MSIDPLAEDYVYNSPYAFAENRVVDGRELEGLEWASSTSSDGKTVNLSLTVKTVNNSVGIITNQQMATMASERANVLTSSLQGNDSQGRTVNASVNYSNTATISWEYNAGLNQEGVKSFEGQPQNIIEATLVQALGITDETGNSQKNRTQINVGNSDIMKFDNNGNAIFDNKETRQKAAQTGAHEDLHVVGGMHETDSRNPNAKVQKADKNNLMNEGAAGTNILPAQRSSIIENIEKQQKKK